MPIIRKRRLSPQPRRTLELLDLRGPARRLSDFPKAAEYRWQELLGRALSPVSLAERIFRTSLSRRRRCPPARAGTPHPDQRAHHHPLRPCARSPAHRPGSVCSIEFGSELVAQAAPGYVHRGSGIEIAIGDLGEVVVQIFGADEHVLEYLIFKPGAGHPAEVVGIR
jgi:hypothetical protein